MINHIHEKHWEKFIHIPYWLDCTDPDQSSPGFWSSKAALKKQWGTLVNPEDGHTLTMPIIKDE